MKEEGENVSYLIVVAHPDDEVLGAGATIRKLTQTGREVNVCILSGEVEIRTNRPATQLLEQDIQSAANVLGVSKVIKGTFPNLSFNLVKHVDLVQFIEAAIMELGAETVFTHHPADLNNDHYHTSIACQAAVRLFQRKPEVKPIEELLFMEVLSSTDWALGTNNKEFRPNVFIEIGEENIEHKIKALSAYRGVMRDYPHPRSENSVRSLATYRGSQAGAMYAEAFESVFRRISMETIL